MDRENYIPTVHWKTDEELPLWQLTSDNMLRVDITEQFGARFRLTALRGIPDEDKELLRSQMQAGTIPCVPRGESYYGHSLDVFNYTHRPGDGWGWHVTNNAMESPGLVKAVVGREIWNMGLGQDFRDHVARHPDDGYTVQFENVPWTFFKRYWRKPINLNRRFHSSRTKTSWTKNYGYMTSSSAVDALHIDPRMLYDYKCMFVDFNRLGVKKMKDTYRKWMLKNAKTFRTMSDHSSPFVSAESEFFFMTEDIFSRIP